MNPKRSVSITIIELMKSVLSFLGVLFFLWVGCLSLRAQSVPAAMGSGARSGFARTVRTVPLDSMRI